MNARSDRELYGHEHVISIVGLDLSKSRLRLPSFIHRQHKFQSTAIAVT
jgi:hypothetical protein